MPKAAIILMCAGAAWLPVGALFALIPVVGIGFAMSFWIVGLGLIAAGALAGMLTDRRAMK